MSRKVDVREVDTAVEQVLAGLRDAEPPVGFELRMRTALRERVVVRVSHDRHRWVWAAAAVVVAVAMAPMLWQRRPAPVVVEKNAIVTPGATSQERNELHAARAIAVSRGGAGKASGIVRSSVEAATDGLEAISGSEVDQRALAEARAPSQPAPPEPLTAQEQRLMHIATQGSEEQKDALNPVVREERYEAAKAEVMKFFEPPELKVEEQE